MSGVQSTRPARHARAARASATRPTSAKRGTGTALYHTRASGLSGSARANGENVAMTCTALAEASPFAGRQHWPTRPSVRSRNTSVITRAERFRVPWSLVWCAAGRRAWARRLAPVGRSCHAWPRFGGGSLLWESRPSSSRCRARRNRRITNSSRSYWDSRGGRRVSQGAGARGSHGRQPGEPRHKAVRPGTAGAGAASHGAGDAGSAASIAANQVVSSWDSRGGRRQPRGGREQGCSSACSPRAMNLPRTATMRGSCAPPGLAGEPTPAGQLRTKRRPSNTPKTTTLQRG